MTDTEKRLRRIEKKIDELAKLAESDHTLCHRCGMTWGEHRAIDLACPTFIDEDHKMNFHHEKKFKPFYS